MALQQNISFHSIILITVGVWSRNEIAKWGRVWCEGWRRYVVYMEPLWETGPLVGVN